MNDKSWNIDDMVEYFVQAGGIYGIVILLSDIIRYWNIF